jgi:hypothetical protein
VFENIDHQVLETRNTCREILDYIGAMEEKFHLLRGFHKSAAILLKKVISQPTSPEKSPTRSPCKSKGQKSPKRVKDRSRRPSPPQPKGTRPSSLQDLRDMYCQGGALSQTMLRLDKPDSRAVTPNQSQPKTNIGKFSNGSKIQFSNKLKLEAINEQFLESTIIANRRVQPTPDLNGKYFVPRAAGFNILSNLNPKLKDSHHLGSEKMDYPSRTPPKRTSSQGQLLTDREMQRAHLDMDNPGSLSGNFTERLIKMSLVDQCPSPQYCISPKGNNNIFEKKENDVDETLKIYQ